jgi:anti-anti-sigma factor
MPDAQPWVKSRTAEFAASPSPSATVITVLGELDAANADELTEYVESHIRQSKRVILDLSALGFVGTAGFSALHRINVVCSAQGAKWALIPGPAMRRLLRICDPDATLPTITSTRTSTTQPFAAASDQRAPGRRGLLQLVPQAR